MKSLSFNKNIILPRYSFIAVIFYDNTNKCLYLVMRKDGKRYKYQDVPEAVFADIMAATNKGSVIAQTVIKASYPCTAMKPVPMATLEALLGQDRYRRYSTDQYTNPYYWLGL
jgi:hypothetical protein